MSRNKLYGDERLLPYLTRLVKTYEERPDPRLQTVPPVLTYLDLRGGEFTARTRDELAEAFDWLTKSLRLGVHDLSDYALMITPMAREQDEQVTGGQTPYIPDDWPTLRERSFLWLPVGETTKRYTWQR